MKKYCFILGILLLSSFKSFFGISGKYKVVLDSQFDKKQELIYSITIAKNKYLKEISKR
jgi:hypothetical protein